MEKDAKYQGHLLKLICDRYPCRVEIKGASTMIRPKTVIVTSNYKIDEIFGDDQAVTDAIVRRFRCIVLVDFNKASGYDWTTIEPGGCVTFNPDHQFDDFAPTGTVVNQGVHWSMRNDS